MICAGVYISRSLTLFFRNNVSEQKLYLMFMKYICTRLIIPIILVFSKAKDKIRIDGDTLEDFFRHAHLDETRRKFLDGLKEGRENSPVEEKSPVMKKQINWGIELVTKHKIHPYSSLRI